MSDKLLPQRLLEDAGRRWPGIWKLADEIRSQQGTSIPDWEPCVFLPFDAWEVIACAAAGKQELPFREVAHVKVLQAVGAWRPGQDIVRFDEDLYRSIADMPLEGKLPCEILTRLPAWAVYMQTPGIEIDGKVCDGFMVYLDQKMEQHELELHFLFLEKAGGAAYPAKIPLGDWTLQEALQNILADVAESSFENGITLMAADPWKSATAGLKTAINLTLYLCAYGFGDKEQAGESNTAYPKARKVKSGWRLFPPDKPKIHLLGETFGAQLRAARQKSDQTNAAGEPDAHASPRPHIRRAHWHGFWTGPKKAGEGERKLGLRWLPPIAVAMREDEEGEE